jgi:DNA-binding NtrC family response regulator
MNDLAGVISKKHITLTVLVVDPDSRALDLAAQHIEHRLGGTIVIKAQSNSPQIGACGESRRVDVLVLDCDGSRPDWNRLLSDFLRSCPDSKVVLTGRSPVPVRKSESILGFLQKPYRVDDLMALIESVRNPDRSIQGD